MPRMRANIPTSFVALVKVIPIVLSDLDPVPKSGGVMIATDQVLSPAKIRSTAGPAWPVGDAVWK